MHTLVEELLALVPAPGAPWPTEARRRWLAAMGAVLDVLYEDGPLRPGATGDEPLPTAWAEPDAWSVVDLREDEPQPGGRSGRHARPGTSYR